MSTTVARNAFGHFLVPPEDLSYDDRVALCDAVIAALQASSPLNPYQRKWLGDALHQFRTQGGDLARHLGLRPVRGSKRTAAATHAQHERDQALIRLQVAIGPDAQTLRVLRGEVPCPKRARDRLDACLKFTVPGSVAAFTRARKRLSHHRP